ncbi:hypothetical protein [Arthrobacter sp. B1805]|uniref:hypothetical protein n=1 Tax=Arthrobacter sp. B1805 TaxID=2058892 RepID=UPI001CA4F2EF|nr:hypothetical protein [Arthrobacter sp. B1805]
MQRGKACDGGQLREGWSAVVVVPHVLSDELPPGALLTVPTAKVLQTLRPANP